MMILSVVFSFLKSFINNLISFFSTKVGQIVLVILIVMGGMWYMHNTGYKKGVAHEKSEALKLYNEKLKNAIQKAKEEQDKAIKEALKSAQKENEIITVYKEKIVQVDKIKSNPKIKDCVLPAEDFKELNKVLDDIK